MKQYNYDKDEKKLNTSRALLNTKMEQIINEQEGVIVASNKLIDKLNSDAKSLTIRLTPYVGTTPKKMDEKYYDLKERYISAVQERAVLQNAITISEESITAAKLNIIPGES